jgi:hypothetical protein
MAGFFQARQAGDLAVGKPALHKFPCTLTVGDALKHLKASHDSDLTLWEELCPLSLKPLPKSSARESTITVQDPSQVSKESLRRCVGRIGMVDIICFLARDESLADQAAALNTPALAIVSDTAFAIQHVDSRTKLIDALAHILDGAQHLVVTIDRSISTRLARYNSLPKPVRRGAPPKSLDASFSLPPRLLTPQEHCCITTDTLTIDANADAISVLPFLKKAAREMTAVAVVEEELKLVGEISPFTMKKCDEKAALALATLSVREFLSLPSTLHLVEARLSTKMENLQEALLSDSDSPVCFPSPLSTSTVYSLDSGEESSSDEEAFGFVRSRSSHFSRPPNVCRPWSSLVAVMAQALTHRVGYIWVTDEENSLLGIVTYLDIIHCILAHLYSSD